MLNLSHRIRFIEAGTAWKMNLNVTVDRSYEQLYGNDLVHYFTLMGKIEGYINWLGRIPCTAYGAIYASPKQYEVTGEVEYFDRLDALILGVIATQITDIAASMAQELVCPFSMRFNFTQVILAPC